MSLIRPWSEPSHKQQPQSHSRRHGLRSHHQSGLLIKMLFKELFVTLRDDLTPRTRKRRRLAPNHSWRLAKITGILELPEVLSNIFQFKVTMASSASNVYGIQLIMMEIPISFKHASASQQTIRSLEIQSGNSIPWRIAIIE